MTRSIVGTVRAGKIEIGSESPLSEGARVTVTFDQPPDGKPRLLQRGKYKYPDGLSISDFREFRRQMSTEWEEEMDEFFPPRD